MSPKTTKKERQKLFIESFIRNSMNMKATSAETGVSANLFQKWKQDPEFLETLENRKAEIIRKAEITTEQFISRAIKTVYQGCLEDSAIALKVLERFAPREWMAKVVEAKVLSEMTNEDDSFQLPTIEIQVTPKSDN